MAMYHPKDKGLVKIIDDQEFTIPRGPDEKVLRR